MFPYAVWLYVDGHDWESLKVENYLFVAAKVILFLCPWRIFFSWTGSDAVVSWPFFSSCLLGGVRLWYACCSLSVLAKQTAPFAMSSLLLRSWGNFMAHYVALFHPVDAVAPCWTGYCVLLPLVLLNAERGFVGGVAHWATVSSIYKTRALAWRGAWLKPQDD